MKHKDDGFDITDMKNESLETSGEIQGLDWSDMNEDFNKGLKRSQSKDSFTIMDDDGQPREKSESPANNGTVGKLKISSEMKEKLEAAMGSRKSSVRETGKERGSLEGLDDSVKKLNENRKMILQQKLGGGGKLKKWENIDQELHYKSAEESNSRKSSHDSKSGNIPIPPPPPIAPSFTKPLHVNTDNHHDSTSLASSYYSPGGSTPVPPPPVAPSAPGLLGRKVERARRDSVSTHNTDHTERFELEESSEFLQSVDGLDAR